MIAVSRAFRQVFSNPKYVLLAVISGFVIFILTTWLPNMELVWQITTSSTISTYDKAVVLTSLIGSIATNFTFLTASLSVATATLFGANLAMAVYIIRLRWRSAPYRWRMGGATSLGGLAFGLFGTGCAACGSVALTPLLSLIGAGGLITMLPFRGEEFSVLGVGLLSISFALTLRIIDRIESCSLPNRRAEPTQISGAT